MPSKGWGNVEEKPQNDSGMAFILFYFLFLAIGHAIPVCDLNLHLFSHMPEMLLITSFKYLAHVFSESSRNIQESGMNPGLSLEHKMC